MNLNNSKSIREPSEQELIQMQKDNLPSFWINMIKEGKLPEGIPFRPDIKENEEHIWGLIDMPNHIDVLLPDLNHHVKWGYETWLGYLYMQPEILIIINDEQLIAQVLNYAIMKNYSGMWGFIKDIFTLRTHIKYKEPEPCSVEIYCYNDLFVILTTRSSPPPEYFTSEYSIVNSYIAATLEKRIKKDKDKFKKYIYKEVDQANYILASKVASQSSNIILKEISKGTKYYDVDLKESILFYYNEVPLKMVENKIIKLNETNLQFELDLLLSRYSDLQNGKNYINY